MRIPLLSWLIFIPICSLLLSFGIFVVSGQCIGDQRDLLIELKKSLKFNSTLSTKLVHWNETSPDCYSWAGVNCSDGGHVIGLNLNNETISGGLNKSSSLFRLQYLQNLSLAYNNFNSSRIPLEFGNLTNLIYLNLSNTGIAGQIPVEISSLTRLVTLDLSNTGIAGQKRSSRFKHCRHLTYQIMDYSTILCQNFIQMVLTYGKTLILVKWG